MYVFMYVCMCVCTVQTFNSCTSRPDVSHFLVTRTPTNNKLRSGVMSAMYPYPGRWVAIGRAVVYYASAAHEFSSGIKCQYCMYIIC